MDRDVEKGWLTMEKRMENGMGKKKVYQDKVYEEEKYYRIEPDRSGMEMVQVAVLICIAVAVGLIFKEKIILFVNSTFDGLLGSGF